MIIRIELNSSQMLERYRFLTIHFVSSEKPLGLIEVYSTLSNTLILLYLFVDITLTTKHLNI